MRDIQQAHWRRYGRNYFTRHDYRFKAKDIAADLFEQIVDRCGKFPEGSGLAGGKLMTNSDPLEGMTATDRCCSFEFHDIGRVVYRLSGTSTEGATLRVHIERYEPPVGNLDLDPQTALAPLIRASRRMAKLARYGSASPSSIS